MNVVIKDKTLIKTYKRNIIDFCLGNVELFKPNGPGRRFFSTTDKNDEFIKYLKESRENIFKSLNIFNYTEEPIFGIFIGVNSYGGSVHEHTDFAPEGMNHLRVNFMLSKPEIGGNPIINGNEIKINEDEGWFNIASQWNHSSSMVGGEKPRIVLSLGCLISDEDLLNSKYLRV